MTIFFIWVITFVLIAYFANKRWDSGVSQGLDKMLPEVLKTNGDNRHLWVLALAILGATTMVRPVDILLVVILLAIIGLVIAKLASWASSKTTH
jgi:phosphoglycerol transferase MdoB-like AlkP superfamily enzyme